MHHRPPPLAVKWLGTSTGHNRRTTRTLSGSIALVLVTAIIVAATPPDEKSNALSHPNLDAKASPPNGSSVETLGGRVVEPEPPEDLPDDNLVNATINPRTDDVMNAPSANDIPVLYEVTSPQSGTYTYVEPRPDDSQFERRIRVHAITSHEGSIRWTESASGLYGESRTSVTWDNIFELTKDGLSLVRETSNFGPSSSDCPWDPPLTLMPADLRVGDEWKYSSHCSERVTVPQGTHTQGRTTLVTGRVLSATITDVLGEPAELLEIHLYRQKTHDGQQEYDRERDPIEEQQIKMLFWPARGIYVEFDEVHRDSYNTSDGRHVNPWVGYTRRLTSLPESST